MRSFRSSLQTLHLCLYSPSDALHNVGIEPGVKWLVEAVKKFKADEKQKGG